MGKDSEAGLNRKFLEFLKLLNIYLNHFPKHEKHALCERIRNTAYELYDLISEAEKRYFKKTTLTQMDIIHERLRMQIYLAYELEYFKFKDGKTNDQNPEYLSGKRYTTLSFLNDEIGKMIGGWIKKLKEENRWG
jgi:23S rRNA-intervening sequence protein